MLSMLYLLSSEEFGEKISSLIFFQLPHEPIEIEKCIPVPQNTEHWHDSWRMLNNPSVHISLGFFIPKEIDLKK